MTTKYNNKSNRSIPKILKYCAAALSVVSFLTTMQGVDELIVDSTLMAGMISFAVQGIILVLGLQFLKVIKTIVTSRNLHVIVRSALCIVIAVLYLSSIVFSSFFSFVYITNSAYKDVGKTDYNVEIDQFLVDNTNKLEQINDESRDELLLNIRTYSSAFSDLLQANKENAANEIQAIVDSVTKYETATIREEDKFTVEGAIVAFRVQYPNADEERIAQIEEACREFETRLNRYINSYEVDYYTHYLDLYDNFKAQIDTSNVEYEQKDIENLISAIGKNRQSLSEETTDSESSVRVYAAGKREAILNYYTNLLTALETLQNNYNKIANNETIGVGEDSELQDFYNAIYASDILDDKNTSEIDGATSDEKTSKIDEASTELRGLLTTYLNSLKENEISSESESEKIKQLSQCIANLDKLKERNELQKEIAAFKSDQLNKVYNIVIPSEETNAEGSTEVSPTEQDVTNVSEDGLDVDTVTPEEWENERRWHINQFIGLLKRVPRSDDDAESAELSEMLDTAYELSRRNLQPISEMEIALNFLKSEHKTVAWIGMAIAIFLDIASFLIGIILFFYKPDDEGKTTLERRSVDEVGQTA